MDHHQWDNHFRTMLIGIFKYGLSQEMKKGNEGNEFLMIVYLAMSYFLMNALSGFLFQQGLGFFFRQRTYAI